MIGRGTELVQREWSYRVPFDHAAHQENLCTRSESHPYASYRTNASGLIEFGDHMTCTESGEGYWYGGGVDPLHLLHPGDSCSDTCWRVSRGHLELSPVKSLTRVEFGGGLRVVERGTELVQRERSYRVRFDHAAHQENLCTRSESHPCASYQTNATGLLSLVTT